MSQKFHKPKPVVRGGLVEIAQKIILTAFCIVICVVENYPKNCPKLFE
jgi:hypothetical protein